MLLKLLDNQRDDYCRRPWRLAETTTVLSDRPGETCLYTETLDIHEFDLAT